MFVAWTAVTTTTVVTMAAAGTTTFVVVRLTRGFSMISFWKTLAM